MTKIKALGGLPGALLGVVDLPGQAVAAPRARKYVQGLFADVTEPRLDDLLLLVTELVSNAIRHSDSGRNPDGQITLVVSTFDGVLQLDVIDEGSARSMPRILQDVPSDSTGGRGLWLVQRLATSWGWYEDPAGRVVWCQLT